MACQILSDCGLVVMLVFSLLVASYITNIHFTIQYRNLEYSVSSDMLACLKSVSALDLWMFPLSPWIYPAFRIGVLRNAVNSLDVRDAKASAPADEATLTEKGPLKIDGY